jgi:methylthioribose-1-phosphate isomerase
LSTIDLGVTYGSETPIEERDTKEVTGFRDIQWAPKNVRVRNPSFDITHADLVTVLITEKDLVHQPNAQNVIAFFDKK